MRLAVIAALLGSGCILDTTQDDERPQTLCVEFADSRTHVPSDAPDRTYLVDSVEFPESANDSAQFGFDIDGDSQGIPDNRLGSVLSALASLDAGDIDGTANEAIATGQLLHLLRVHAASFGAADNAVLELRHGLDTDGDPTDNFSGTEVFQFDTSLSRGRLGGDIDAAVLRASGGRLPIAMAVPGEPEVYPLMLEAAQIEAVVSDDRMEGRIGGAIPEQDVTTSFLPFLAVGLQVAVDRDCPDGTCQDGSFGDVLLEYLDEDGDGAISTQDLQDSSLVAGLLAPDVDIFGEDGRPFRACDGVDDALTVAFRFTAVATGN